MKLKTQREILKNPNKFLRVLTITLTVELLKMK
jgi:hypothetical protein